MKQTFIDFGVFVIDFLFPMGTYILLNPSFSASNILCSIRLTALTSPDRPTSPAKTVSEGSAISILDESIAITTPKSIAGSATFIPPAIFINTSLVANLNPTRFSRTASNIFNLRPSNPVAVL